MKFISTLMMLTMLFTFSSKEKLNNQLFDAVDKNNLKQIELLLSKGAEIDAKKENDENLLYYSIIKGNKKIYEYLILNGAEINNIDYDYYPLFAAIYTENIELVEFLLKNNANINICTGSGDTVLHITSNICNEKLFILFLNKGVDINIKNMDWETPLHDLCISVIWTYDSKRDYIKMLKLLLQKGADPNVKDKTGETPLKIAQFRNDKLSQQQVKILDEIVRILKPITIENMTEKLFHAVDKNDLKKIEFLLSKGADINSQNENNENLLYYSIMKKNKKIYEYLIQKGADINVINHDNYSPLFAAIFTENYELVELLLRKNVDLDINDALGNSILHISCKLCNEKLILLFLNESIDINIKNYIGETPLHILISSVISSYNPKKNYMKVFKLLLKNGANPNIKDEADETPLKIAQFRNDKLSQEQIKILDEIVKTLKLITKVK
jgi:ankyrin repeat protein